MCLSLDLRVVPLCGADCAANAANYAASQGALHFTVEICRAQKSPLG